MGPIERELREVAERFRCGSGEAGGWTYEFWGDLATFALSEAAAAGFDEGADFEHWSDAIEAAEALGL